MLSENGFDELDFDTFQVSFDVVSFLLIDLMNSFYMGHLTHGEVYCFLEKYRCLAMDLCPGDQLEDLKKISVLNVIESFFDSADLLPEYAIILYNDIETLLILDLISAWEYPLVSISKT